MLETLGFFVTAWTDPWLIFLVAAGTFAGIYIGAIPGLSVTMATSILISFTFKWDVNEALALISGVFFGGVYGGSRTAILLNIPGAPSAIVTAIEGYPLAKRGEAGEAIGLTTVMSVFGGFIGIIALALFAPVISEFALMFQSRDYLLLGIIGILLVGTLSGESFAKGAFAGALGVLIGMVGLDPMTAEGRFTFGSIHLLGGIPYVAAMIGFFGVAEALVQLNTLNTPAIKQKIDRIIPKFSDVKKYFWLAIRASGTGNREGLVAPEAANNAAVGGAHIPMLTLGISGDAVTAVIIGALFIHGLKPGPLLLVETPHLFWFIVGTLTLANIFLLVFGLTGIRLFTKIFECPKAVLIPLIIVLSAVGTYAIQNNPVDVYWMLLFGVVGYFMKTYGFEVGPVILGVILGPMMDSNYRRTMLRSRGDVADFIWGFLSNPISLVLTIGLVLMLISQTPIWSFIRDSLRTKRA